MAHADCDLTLRLHAATSWPTEREYRDVKHHDKWVIPWLEDDAGLLVTQLWVNRTLNYSLQGINYGATGLMGT